MNLDSFVKLSHIDQVDYLTKQAKLYYNGKGSDLSDSQYDELYEYFKVKNPEGIVQLKVGVLPDSNMTKLPVYMGSLDKVKPNTKEYTKFFTDDDYTISEKLDGVSILLNYSKFFYL